MVTLFGSKYCTCKTRSNNESIPVKKQPHVIVVSYILQKITALHHCKTETDKPIPDGNNVVCVY